MSDIQVERKLLKGQSSSKQRNIHLILYIIAFIFASLDVVGIILNVGILHYFKHIMMISFIIIAFRSCKIIVVIALFFGMLGDILLMVSSQLEGPQDTKKLFFLLGAGAFLIGHIFYIINNFKKINREEMQNTSFAKKVMLIVLTVIGLSFYIFQDIFYFVTKIQLMLIVVVAVYGGFLATMVTSNIITYHSKEDISSIQYILRVLGGFIFFLSDSMIMYSKTSKEGQHMYNSLFIIITYNIAQLFLLKGNQQKSGLFSLFKSKNQDYSKSILSQQIQ